MNRRKGWRISSAHCQNFPLLHLRHSSFSNPSVALSTHSPFSSPCFASPTLQALHLHHLASCPLCGHICLAFLFFNIRTNLEFFQSVICNKIIVSHRSNMRLNNCRQSLVVVEKLPMKYVEWKKCYIYDNYITCYLAYQLVVVKFA